MLLSPPDVRVISPADLWRAFLDPIPARSFFVEFSDVGLVRLRARALGSHAWVSAHRDLVRDAEARDPAAEARFLSLFVTDDDGRSLSAGVVLGLYEHEAAALFNEAVSALRTISPTYAAADVSAWLAVLKEGAKEPENLSDALSLGACRSVSFGMGRGAVHVRDEPEAFFGIPRRDLVDAHWLAYHAAVRVRTEILK